MEKLKLEDLSRRGLISLVEEYDDYINNYICLDEQNDINKWPVRVNEYLNNEFLLGKNESDYKIGVISFADKFADIYTETSAEIMDVFEQVLDDLDITLPDENREGDPDEARIFGETYYNMESQVEDILDTFIRQIHGSIIDKCRTE